MKLDGECSLPGMKRVHTVYPSMHNASQFVLDNIQTQTLLQQFGSNDVPVIQQPLQSSTVLAPRHPGSRNYRPWHGRLIKSICKHRSLWKLVIPILASFCGMLWGILLAGPLAMKSPTPKDAWLVPQMPSASRQPFLLMIRDKLLNLINPNENFTSLAPRHLLLAVAH